MPYERILTWTVRSLICGALIRKQLRHALKSAKILGAEVSYIETKYLLESEFTFRVKGTKQQLYPLAVFTVTYAENPPKELDEFFA